jgi:hypothetical protein
LSKSPKSCLLVEGPGSLSTLLAGVDAQHCRTRVCSTSLVPSRWLDIFSTWSATGTRSWITRARDLRRCRAVDRENHRRDPLRRAGVVRRQGKLADRGRRRGRSKGREFSTLERVLLRIADAASGAPQHCAQVLANPVLDRRLRLNTLIPISDQFFVGRRSACPNLQLALGIYAGQMSKIERPVGRQISPCGEAAAERTG